MFKRLRRRLRPKFKAGDVVQYEGANYLIAKRWWGSTSGHYYYDIGRGYGVTEDRLRLIKSKPAVSKCKRVFFLIKNQFTWSTVQSRLGNDYDFLFVSNEVAAQYKITKDEEVLQYFRDYMDTGNKDSYLKGVKALEEYGKEEAV